MTELIPRDAVRNEVARLGKEFLDGGSPTAANVLNLAMDRINAIPPIDPAAIREAALRGAAELVRSTAYTSSGGNRSLEPVATGLAGMDMHHATIAAAILALIGEKK